MVVQYLVTASSRSRTARIPDARDARDHAESVVPPRRRGARTAHPARRGALCICGLCNRSSSFHVRVSLSQSRYRQYVYSTAFHYLYLCGCHRAMNKYDVQCLFLREVLGALHRESARDPCVPIAVRHDRILQTADAARRVKQLHVQPKPTAVAQKAAHSQ